MGHSGSWSLFKPEALAQEGKYSSKSRLCELYWQGFVLVFENKALNWQDLQNGKDRIPRRVLNLQNKIVVERQCLGLHFRRPVDIRSWYIAVDDVDGRCVELVLYCRGSLKRRITEYEFIVFVYDVESQGLLPTLDKIDDSPPERVLTVLWHQPYSPRQIPDLSDSEHIVLKMQLGSHKVE